MFCLNGWLCGVSMLLCYLLVLMVSCFCCCVFGTDANVLQMRVFLPICLVYLGVFCSSVWVWKI